MDAGVIVSAQIDVTNMMKTHDDKFIRMRLRAIGDENIFVVSLNTHKHIKTILFEPVIIVVKQLLTLIYYIVHIISSCERA